MSRFWRLQGGWLFLKPLARVTPSLYFIHTSCCMVMQRNKRLDDDQEASAGYVPFPSLSFPSRSPFFIFVSPVFFFLERACFSSSQLPAPVPLVFIPFFCSLRHRLSTTPPLQFFLQLPSILPSTRVYFIYYLFTSRKVDHPGKSISI